MGDAASRHSKRIDAQDGVLQAKYTVLLSSFGHSGTSGAYPAATVAAGGRGEATPGVGFEESTESVHTDTPHTPHDDRCRPAVLHTKYRHDGTRRGRVRGAPSAPELPGRAGWPVPCSALRRDALRRLAAALRSSPEAPLERVEEVAAISSRAAQSVPATS